MKLEVAQIRKMMKAAADFLLRECGRNRWFLMVVLYFAVLFGCECAFYYFARINGSFFNPLFQGIWLYAAFLGICLFMGGKAGKILLSVFIVIVSLATLIACYFAGVFKLELSGDAFFVLGASSSEEIREFLGMFVDWRSIVGALVSLTAMGVVLFFFWKKAVLRHTYFTMALAVLLVLPILINTCRFLIKKDYESLYDRCMLSNFSYGYFNYRKSLARLVKMERSPKLPEKIRRINPDTSLIGVLVIGESATRNHMGIYGYPRNTTPNLAANRQDLLIYDDVISAYSHTIYALRFLLTPETWERREYFPYTVFDVLNAAGIRTLLLSNQYRWGKYDGPVSLLTAHISERRYFQEESRRAHDAIMVPEIERRIAGAEEPTLLVVHLMGSHGGYDNRYPESFQIFDGLRDKCNQGLPDKFVKEINQYDNTIIYTDFVLGKIIEALKKVKRPAYMLYLSDHGDFPGSGTPRSGVSSGLSHYEIPFLLWTNREYREAFPEFMESAKRNLHAPMQTDHATWSLLSSAQVTFDGFPGEEDIFSAAFRPQYKRAISDERIPYRKKNAVYPGDESKPSKRKR